MPGRPPQAQVRPHEVAIVGNDMLLAALPGRAVQLAHAVLAAGFDLVVPVSWGEELLAHRTLRALEEDGPRPLVFCACQRVRRRLLASGQELVPHLLSLVAPPVATARYLRALQPDVPIRITYLGACEEACDRAIDRRIPPAEFLDHLERSGISILGQPDVFESTIPPDRRRHWSQPGGVPTAEALAATARSHALRVIDTQELVTEIADQLLTAERLLIDVGPSLGCVCAGAVAGKSAAGARASLVALEPPRSQFPVVDVNVLVPLEEPLASHREARVAQPSVATPDKARRPASGARSRQGQVASASERRRFAVTPARVSEVGGPVIAHPVQSDKPEPQPKPVAAARARVGLRTEPTEPPAPAPAEVSATDDHRDTQVPTPIESAPAIASQPPEGPPLAAPRPTPQRRTTTHELRRVAAQVRKHSSQRPTPPRGYAAFRPHRPHGESPPSDEALPRRQDEPEVQEPTLVVPAPEPPPLPRTAPVEPATAIDDTIPPASDDQRRRTRGLRSGARLEPAPLDDRPRRLRVLLFSVVLIAAIGVLLFVMLGG